MARAMRHGAALLTVGTLASGVLAYVFIVLAARALGSDAYGPIATLWAAVFLVSVVLYRPLEQTLSRGISERLARGESARPVVVAVGRLTAALTAVALVAIAIGWGPITERLFEGNDALTAAFAVGVAGYSASFVLRGIAGGVQWLDGYGLLLLADGAVRVLLALPLLFVASQAIGAAAVAAAAIGGALVPLAVRSRRRLRAAVDPSGEPAPFALGGAARFAAPATVMAAADQVLVSGGALLVGLSGDTKAAGTVFAATMLVRAPVFLFQGCAAALLPSLTSFQAVGDERTFRRRVVRASAVFAAFGALLGAGTLAVGPEAMRLLLGAEFDVARGDLTLLALGVGCYLISATCSQAVLARGMAGRAAVCWGLAATLFVAVQVTVGGSPMHTVSVAFALAALLNVVLFLALALAPAARRPLTLVAPARAGSTLAVRDAA